MTTPLDILTVEEMSAADHAAVAAGTISFDLMSRAGEGVAQAIVDRFTPRSALVLCGPGDNGGDGYVTAAALDRKGWPVRVAGAAKDRLKGDAARAAAGWPAAVSALEHETLDGVDLIVDALFGAGLKRPLETDAKTLFERAHSLKIPIVAVDLPSGLSGDSGRPLDFAPMAKLTVTFHRQKPGHVLEPGRSYCGEIAVVDIGLARPEHSRLAENAPDLWAPRFPWPKTDGYKSNRGHLMVVSGPAAKTGAARLASRAGLRVGAGLVTVLSPPGAVLVNAAHLEAVMLVAFNSEAELQQAASSAKAVVIGPAAGVGPATRQNCSVLSKLDAALVVDADALTTFKDDPQNLFSLLTARDVMTPHPGEFERVFPSLLASASNRIEAAREAARRSGAVVLLKGADTVIAAPDGQAAVNTNGAPWLATAGSGDVLAGLIGGLIAQGMSSFDAACAGAWLHGAAGAAFGPGLTSEDLPGLIPDVLGRLYGARNRS